MKVNPILAIAVIALAVLLFFPNILSQFGIPGIGDQGTANLGLTINYVDGSSKVFEDGGFSIFPLTIADSGGEVKSFIVTVGMRVTHTFSHISAYTMKVLDFDAKVMNSEGGLIGYLVQDFTKTKSLNADWISGEAKGQSMGEFEASELESILSTQPYGDYHLDMTADVSLDLTSDSGETATRTGSGSASWSFSYTSEGEIQSLSVTINTYPYRT